MSDIDDDFMCEDEEDYGLVRVLQKTLYYREEENDFPSGRLWVNECLCDYFYLMGLVCCGGGVCRNTPRIATRNRMLILRISTTTVRR